ncbi:MAG: redoxin domain-containing protein [Chloroflexota bacterium]|nr:redoxin domain-containing protein [Chloroflexota bacterium]
MTGRQRYAALGLVVLVVVGAIALIEIVISPPEPTVGVGLPGADEAQAAAPAPATPAATQAIAEATGAATPRATAAGTTAPTAPAITSTAAPAPATSSPTVATSAPAPVTSAPTPAPTPQVVVGQLPELPVIGTAPEFAGITAWLNSEVLTMDELRGRPVLIDFWTFGCINCIRTLPHVRAWHDAYAPHGLVIVGVHTPEFNHEYEEANVRESLPSRGVIWPVAMDNGYKTWRAYKNRFWPHKFLIDQEGQIRYHHIGEGAYQETEKAIRALLAEGGTELSHIPLSSAAIPHKTTPSPSIGPRSLFAGSGFAFGSYLGNPTGTPDDGARVFTDNVAHDAERLYLDGRWDWVANAALAQPQADETARVSVPFHAQAVSVSFGVSGNESVRVNVTVDGEPIPADRRGGDVLTGPDGQTHLLVDQFRLYDILRNAGESVGELQFSVGQRGLALYTVSLS